MLVIIRCEAYINVCEVPSTRSQQRVISFASSVFLTAPQLVCSVVVISKRPDPVLSTSCQLIKPILFKKTKEFLQMCFALPVWQVNQGGA